MTCNFAVAITKAVIADTRLRALLDLHSDQVQRILVQLLSKQFQGVRGSSDPRVIQVERLTLRVIDGKLSVDGPRGSEREMKSLSERATTLLTQVADQLFAHEVGLALKACATVVGIRTADVENQGVLQRATVFSLVMQSLQARVFALPGGRMQIFIDTGTFGQAKTATKQLLATLQVQGVDVQMVGEVESHRTGGDHLHVPQTERNPLL